MDAWNFGAESLSRDAGNLYLKNTMFWVAYAAMKEIQGRVKERESKKPSPQEHHNINAWLDRVDKLHMPVPSEELDFRFFNLFRGCGEHYSGFIRFVLKHGSNLFQASDLRPYVTDNGEAPSLVTRTARQVANAWLGRHSDWGIAIEPVLALLDFAEQRTTDTDKTWIKYDYAKCLIRVERFEEAREYIIPVLRRKLSESWAWGPLAATYYREDHEASIACYCKGISEAREPKFSVTLRLGLTKLLAKSGSHDLASSSLNALLEIYRTEGWSLKPAHERLRAAHWFDETTVDQTAIEDFIAEKAGTAIRFASGATETLIGTVDAHHRSGKGFNVFMQPGHKLAVRKGLFKGEGLPEVGSAVKLVCTADSGDREVLEARATGPYEDEYIEWTEGELIMNPRGFAFVNDSFVAPHLANALWHGKVVRALRVFDINPKTDQPSWRAIRLEKPAE